MPSNYEFDPEVLRVVFGGRHTPEDDLALISEAAGQPQFTESTALLLDFTRSQEDRTREEIIGFANFLCEIPGGAKRCCAVVVADALHYGLARMLAVYAEQGGTRVKVFRELSQARAWLDSERRHPGAPDAETQEGEQGGS